MWSAVHDGMAISTAQGQAREGQCGDGCQGSPRDGAFDAALEKAPQDDQHTDTDDEPADKHGEITRAHPLSRAHRIIGTHTKIDGPEGQ